MRREEPAVETQELSERVLRIIGGYGMGTALDARDPSTKTARTPPPNPVPVPAWPNGRPLHVAGDERRTLATSPSLTSGRLAFRLEYRPGDRGQPRSLQTGTLRRASGVALACRADGIDKN